MADVRPTWKTYFAVPLLSMDKLLNESIAREFRVFNTKNGSTIQTSYTDISILGFHNDDKEEEDKIEVKDVSEIVSTTWKDWQNDQ